PTRFGSNATEFFCGTPTKEVGPVADVMTPIFTWAWAEAISRALAASTQNVRRNFTLCIRGSGRASILSDSLLTEGRLQRTPLSRSREMRRACEAQPIRRRERAISRT